MEATKSNSAMKRDRDIFVRDMCGILVLGAVFILLASIVIFLSLSAKKQTSLCLDNVEALIEEAGGYVALENKHRNQYYLLVDSCVVTGGSRGRSKEIRNKIKYGAEDWEKARDEIRATVLQGS